NSRQFALSSLWIIYGVVMLIVGITRNQGFLRAIAGVILALTTGKVIVVDVAYHRALWHTTIFNETFATLAMLVFGFAAAAWLYSRSTVPDKERDVIAVLIAAANVLALVALTTESIGYFHRELTEVRKLNAQGVGEVELLQLNSSMHFVITAIWSIYAAVALWIGFRRRSKSVRIGALLLLGFATAKVLSIDARFYAAAWHTFLMNQTFAAFVMIIAVMVLAFYLYVRSGAVEGVERSQIMPILVASSNILALTSLSLE